MEEILTHLKPFLSIFTRRESVCSPAIARPGRDWLVALTLLFAGILGTAVFVSSFYLGGNEGEDSQVMPLRPVLDAGILDETLSLVRIRAEDHARVGEKVPVDPSR